MNDLDTLDLASLLPSSIADDEEVQALAKVVTQKLLNINDSINTLLLWKNLSRYDDTILLHLAWEYILICMMKSFQKMSENS